MQENIEKCIYLDYYYNDVLLSIIFIIFCKKYISSDFSGSYRVSLVKNINYKDNLDMTNWLSFFLFGGMIERDNKILFSKFFSFYDTFNYISGGSCKMLEFFSYIFGSSDYIICNMSLSYFNYFDSFLISNNKAMIVNKSLSGIFRLSSFIKIFNFNISEDLNISDLLININIIEKFCDTIYNFDIQKDYLIDMSVYKNILFCKDIICKIKNSRSGRLRLRFSSDVTASKFFYIYFECIYNFLRKISNRSGCKDTDYKLIDSRKDFTIKIIFNETLDIINRLPDIFRYSFRTIFHYKLYIIFEYYLDDIFDRKESIEKFIKYNDLFFNECYKNSNKINSKDIITYIEHIFTDKFMYKIKKYKFIEDKDNYRKIELYNSEYKKFVKGSNIKIENTYYGIMISVLKTIYLL
jgi:hypothetical protein